MGSLAKYVNIKALVGHMLRETGAALKEAGNAEVGRAHTHTHTHAGAATCHMFDCVNIEIFFF